METLSEFAARWAAADFEGDTYLHASGRNTWFQRVTFNASKRDPVSPIARELAGGKSEDDLYNEFVDLWDAHYKCLEKLAGMTPIEDALINLDRLYTRLSEPSPWSKRIESEKWPDPLGLGITSL